MMNRPGRDTGITRRITISRRHAVCPRCGCVCGRHSFGVRRLHEVGSSAPTILHVTYSKHYCKTCRKHFNVGMDHIAPAFGRYTRRVRNAALAILSGRRATLEQASHQLRRLHHVHVPPTTMHDWWNERGGGAQDDRGAEGGGD